MNSKKINHLNTDSVSLKLNKWLKTDDTPTLQEFNEAFSDEGMGLLIMILMAPSALPVPTGGLTQLFEPLAFIIALQLLFGRQSLWLPRSMRSLRITDTIKSKVISKLMRFIEKAENLGNTKFKTAELKFIEPIASVLIIIFIAGAFFAPPFSFLDTLPAAGASLLALSLVNHNKKLFFIAVSLGLIGLVLEIFFSAVVITFIKNLSSKF